MLQKKHKQILCGLTGLIFASLLFFTMPLLLLSLLLGLGIVYIKRNEIDNTKTKQTGFILTPAIIGLTMAYVLASTVDQFSSTFKPDSQMALVPMSWLKLIEIQYSANNAGRIGFIIGSIIGMVAVIYLAGLNDRRERNSSTDTVRGRKVLAGGYATKIDILDRCDFGFPHKNQNVIPLGLMDNQLLSVNTNKGKIKMAGHALVIGATGTGKSYSYIMPQIIAAALAGHSVVVTDPKGELFTDTAKWLETQGYEIIPFNVANPLHSFRWNMIEECRDMSEVMDLAEWAIMSSGDDEAFWSGGEVNLLGAIIGYIKYSPAIHNRNIRNALRALANDQQSLDNLITSLIQADNIDDIRTEILTMIEIWQGTQKLFQNYVEGVRNKLRIITKGTMEHLTMASDFSLAEIGGKKTALFLILPEEGEYQALLAPFYAFMFRRLNEKAAACGGKLPVPTRFIMDEFANIGRVPDIDKVCALGRSKGIMVHMAVQNIGQLQGLYRRNNTWEAVAGNCPIKFCLSVDDMNSARFFTELMGEAEIEDISEHKNITTPIDRMQLKNKIMYTKETETMKPYELRQLPEDDCIALLRGKRPIYLKKLGWPEYPQAAEIQKSEKINPADWPLPEIISIIPEEEQSQSYIEPEQDNISDSEEQHPGIF